MGQILKMKSYGKLLSSQLSAAIILWGLFLSVGFPVSAFPETDNKMKVFVSILPQKYFVERIGGDFVDIEVMVGPGQSPATYDPTPRQMSDIEHARVYFQIGVPFENQMLRKIREIFRDLDIVDTQAGVELRRMETFDDDHDNGQAHGALDPHSWLDPRAVKIMARNICDELIKLDPDNRVVYESNLTEFHADLDSLDSTISRKLEPYRGRRIYVFHPVYGYFADRYGLKQVAVEIEGKAPRAKQLVDFIDRARADSIKVIFVQPQFSTKAAETIADAVGGKVMKVDPLAEDYLKNLKNIANYLEKGLSE